MSFCLQIMVIEPHRISIRSQVGIYSKGGFHKYVFMECLARMSSSLSIILYSIPGSMVHKLSHTFSLYAIFSRPSMMAIGRTSVMP